MKTHSFFRITAVLLVLLSARSSFAQEIIKTDTLGTVVIRSTSLVNKNVTMAFTRQFKDAVSPRWYTLDKNYLVKFIQKDQRNNALYNKKGYLVYHISYMNGNSLPREIQAKINSQYADGIALTAIHVNEDARSIWIVNLKVGQYFVLARVEGEEVEEAERYTDTSI